MTLDEIKSSLIKAVEDNREEIYRIGDEILKNPELGYKEEKTSALLRAEFDKLGIKYEYPCAITGVKGKLHGRDSKANVCVIGELDALKCVGSPISNEYGAAHACGHNAQIAALIGTAIAFAKSGVLSDLDGDVTFLAAPAEEFIETDYRESLKKENKIKYFGGKQQLISEGVFDDIDMAVLIHAQPNEEKTKLYLKGNNLGFLAKKVTFHGKAVHGSTPFDGVNALNAASLAILGVHANRETFREEEKIRIHPIITKGGDVVNSVPDEVCIDTYIRGATLDAIKKGNTAFERSALGAAQMVGASVEFENIPGYLPLCESKELSQIFEENAIHLMGKENMVYGKEITGSSDIGDLSCIIPVIQPSIGGFIGDLHSREFHICDRETAYLKSAELMAVSVAELLYNGAKKARLVKESFKPRLTKTEYIDYLERG